MRVLVQHRSTYHYPEPALLGPQTIRLRPADHARAAIEGYRLTIAPEHKLHWQRDPHGNHVARVSFKAGQRTSALDILVEMTVDVRPVNPFDFLVDDRAKQVPFAYPDGLADELAPFLETGDPAYRLGRAGTTLVGELPRRADTVGMLVDVVGRVAQRVSYVIRDEAGIWTPEETLAHGRGSCRDSAALLVALLRARGIAARFVSGYLIQLADEGMIPDEPRGVGRDVVDLHAWAEAFVPGAGWIGLDGTSGLLCGEGHIALAATATPAHAAPLEGTAEFAASGVGFATTIQRLGHEARPTAPYTDDVWAALVAAGDRVDEALAAAGLSVWSGGEPTFVARAGQGADEWQGGALGEDKWTKGRALAEKLRDRLAPGGVVLHRMGKQYPGEPLPRWALDAIGARDSRIWPARVLRDSGAIADARGFGEALAAALGVPAALHAAHEDPWEKLKAEAALPIGELRMLPDGIAGYVLPLAREGGDWKTQRWDFRRGALYLVPGSSPIGLRLPLASLAAAPPQPEWADEPDLPDPRRAKQDVRVEAAPAAASTGAAGPAGAPLAPAATIRTAIALEPRDGQLWLFLPPLSRGDDFLALVGAIDSARAATGLAVHLEGYAPPPSPRLVRFAVTPDPGVLEVNLPPVDSCRAVTDLHHTVFDAALASGLTAERYLLDGRLAGSGGGNHITIGGPTTAQSPWLVRPDLLGSLVTFAQHHPSLAYLFSGLFVGPTSQAPRVDEARHEALAELELALPQLFAKPVPWQVDALLRHLLVDVTGSTHRAEISIDKLFDPVAPFGRMGLVELRAFEMPPHPRMAAAQAILVRALVAAFAAQPYRHPLVRWGSELHDRFLLPYYLWRDFADVLALTGLPADAFRPFVELRCPLAGALDVAGGRLEIRNALEPWHVLGEEATAVGTARYVDSSVERIEVRAIGLPEERYAIAVNGIGVPLRAPDGRDLRVGGVRFRAWCPPHALHPHLGIHHPLRFAVIDRWAKRAVAGAAYHVWHPEGRAFDAAPLTRVEAEARRAQRFTREGAPSTLREVAPDPTHPYTLDLRRIDAGAPMPDPEEW